MSVRASGGDLANTVLERTVRDPLEGPGEPMDADRIELAVFPHALRYADLMRLAAGQRTMGVSSLWQLWHTHVAPDWRFAGPSEEDV